MIYIIGIGLDGVAGLSPRARRIIDKAGLIVAGARHLAGVGAPGADKMPVKGPLEDIASAISKHIDKRRGKSIAVLATGDPLLFGIGEFILNRYGKKRVEIIPAVSTVQEAFARIKESSAGARVFSAHGRSVDLNALAHEIKQAQKAAVFTDPDNTPAKIASALIASGADGFTPYVCESLGEKGEKTARTTLPLLAKRKAFSALNILLLVRKPLPKKTGPAEAPFLFGIPDALFSHSRGMITKEELRVISLAKLKLTPESVVWDIGAGSGSIAVEAGRIASGGMVYAVEKEPVRISDVQRNIKRFSVKNVKLIKGSAPEALKGLKPPDAVFVGGGGSGVTAILKAASKPLKRFGRVVVNAVTIETVSRAVQYFKENGWDWETLLISVSKSKSVGDLSLLKANNPVFIVTGIKP